MELLTLLALANLVVGVLIFSVLRSINQGLSLSRAEHPLPFSAQELLEQKMRTEAEARKAVALSEQVTDKWGGKKLESSADELALRLEQLEVEWQENRHSHEVMRYALMIRANGGVRCGRELISDAVSAVHAHDESLLSRPIEHVKKQRELREAFGEKQPQ